MLHKALQFLGIQPSVFKTHAFRIEGATNLYMKGFSDEY